MITTPNIPDPDAFYAALLEAQDGLDAAATADFQARLLFLLANQCGAQDVLLECIAAACDSAEPAPTKNHTP